MNDAITAIGELWKLGVVIFLILAIILFRLQIRNLLDRLKEFTFRRGDSEAKFTLANEPATHDEESEDLEQMAAVEAPPPSDRTDDDASAEEGDVPDWNMKMFTAYIDRDLEKLQDAFEGLQKAETEISEMAQNEGFYLYLRYQLGDVSVLEKLYLLAEKPEISGEANFWIARCFEHGGNFQKAASHYEISTTTRETEEEKAYSVVALARCQFELNDRESSIATLMRGLSEDPKSDAAHILYIGLADLYKKTEEIELRAIALEKAVELRPNEADSLFEAAYSYGQREFIQLSLLHYESLIKYSPNNQNGLNNLGVAFNKLNMPIRAVDYYLKAMSINSSLAAANLAKKFLNEGFREDATELLTKAQAMDDVHANVGTASASILNSVEKESKRRSEIFDSARKQQLFLRSYGEAYFVQTFQDCRFEGVWQDEDGTEVVISNIGNDRIEGVWAGETKLKFDGSTVNRAAKTVTYKWSYQVAKGEFDFEQDKQGYLYLSRDNNQISIMTGVDADNSFRTLTRIVDTTDNLS